MFTQHWWQTINLQIVFTLHYLLQGTGIYLEREAKKLYWCMHWHNNHVCWWNGRAKFCSVWNILKYMYILHVYVNWEKGHISHLEQWKSEYFMLGNHATTCTIKKKFTGARKFRKHQLIEANSDQTKDEGGGGKPLLTHNGLTLQSFFSELSNASAHW